mmetsp:Transcript_7828/g.17276  ORF Transcript_7828/g.17276 Transcript_7828/m.17276 type:complete len:82 (-) Transcript_7828:34-279(-)
MRHFQELLERGEANLIQAFLGSNVLALQEIEQNSTRIHLTDHTALSLSDGYRSVAALAHSLEHQLKFRNRPGFVSVLSVVK